MARELTYKTLCENLATKCYLSERKVDAVIQNLVLLMASELQNNSYINIKNIGKFNTEIRGGTDEWFETETGKMEKKYVKPFSYVDFTPSQNLLDVVNGESISFLFKEPKLKMDKPTPFEDLVEQNMMENRRGIKTKAQTSNDYLNDVLDTLNKRKEKKEKVKDGQYANGKHTNLKELNEEKSRPVLCLNNNVIYPSISCTATQLGLNANTLYANLMVYKTNKCGGYKFKLVEKEKGKEKNG